MTRREAELHKALKAARRLVKDEYECLVNSVCVPDERPNKSLSNVDWANRDRRTAKRGSGQLSITSRTWIATAR